MKRCEEIEMSLFDNLSREIKISLTMNCWSTSNRQFYMSIIAFFIDKYWKYHEILIEFEYMKGKHTDSALVKVVEDILKKHNIQQRILVIITDNASNNEIFFVQLMKNLKEIASIVNVSIHDDINSLTENDIETSIDDNNIASSDDILHTFDTDKSQQDNEINNDELTHVSCLAHVLQLTLQTFLDSVRVNSINDELQKNWNDQENSRVINQAAKELSLTLVKMSVYSYLY